MEPSTAEHPAARFRAAVEHYRAGRLHEALPLLAALAEERPDDGHVRLAWATALLRAGERRQGIAVLQALLEREPGNAAAHYQLGVALDEEQQTSAAAQCYRRAVEAKANFAEAHYNLGTALGALGRHDEALASFESATRLRPAYARAQRSLANTLRRLKRRSEAVAAYERAIGLDPANADAYANLAATLNELGRFAEALACSEQALARHPQHAQAHGHRADALAALRRFDEARTSYERAIELGADAGPWLGSLYDVARTLCRWDGLDTLAARLVAGIEAGRRVIDPFTAMLLTGEPPLLQRAAATWAQELYAGAKARPPRAGRRADGRIRIGYFSADFYRHPVMHLIAEMLESHDRSRFEVVGFSLGQPADDDWTAHLRAAFDRYLDGTGLADHEVAERARELGIDIAIDLNGYTKNARPGVFAAGCAPVQASYLGYPGTMAAPFIDYVIADPTVIPDADRRHYTEAVAWLPECYQPNRRRCAIAARVYGRADCGLPPQAFVFCCFNNHNRIAPEVFRRWMRILARTPDSVLWLLAGERDAGENLRAEARRCGIDPGRLVFADAVPVEAHLSRLRLADLFLDTLPYNAHTTASDALRVGVPLLTAIGTGFAGRVAASLLKTLGLDELVTDGADAYEALAVALATTPSRLAGIRHRLTAAVQTSPLYDPARSARHIERLYERMLARSDAGLAPDHIALAPLEPV
jgi:protein O-GlcNAc transferase